MRLVHLFAIVSLLPAAAQSKHASSNQLIAEARSAQQANDLLTAARDFRLAVDMHPKDVAARVGLGAVLTQQARFDEAVVQLQAALPLTSAKQRPSVLTALGLAYSENGDHEAARPPLQEALTLRPGNPLAARLLAEADLNANDAVSALAVLVPRAGAAAIDPDFGRVFGLALVRNGKLSDGAQALQHAAEATGDPGTFRLAGIAYLDAGNNDSARRELETARSISDNLPDIDGLVGIARERCGDRYAAELIFRHRLKVEPENFQANLYLGAILLKRADAAGAAPYLNHALTLRPSDAVALYEMALLEIAGNQAGKAAESLDMASAKDPSWAEPHLQLAVLLDNQHRPAMADAERALAASLTAEQMHKGVTPPHLP